MEKVVVGVRKTINGRTFVVSRESGDEPMRLYILCTAYLNFPAHAGIMYRMILSFHTVF